MKLAVRLAVLAWFGARLGDSALAGDANQHELRAVPSAVVELLAVVDGGDPEALAVEAWSSGTAELAWLVEAYASAQSGASACFESPLTLDARRERFFARAFELAGTDALRSYADALHVDTTCPAHAAALAKLIAPKGGGEDVARIARLVDLASSEPNYELHAAEKCADAIAALLLREPRAIAAVELAARRSEPAGYAMLVAALGRRGGNEALDVLSDLVGAFDDHDSLVFSAVTQASATAGTSSCENAAARVRPHLVSAAPTKLQACAAALGALRDIEALPDLIELLETSEGGVRKTVHASLCRIAERSFPATVSAWKTWHRREVLWYSTEAAGQLARAAEGSSADALDALRVIGQHPLFRDALAADIVELLDHDDPRVRAATCDASARLRSRHSARPLAMRLGDEEASVSDAARRALEEILKADPGVDATECLAQLQRLGL